MQQNQPYIPYSTPNREAQKYLLLKMMKIKNIILSFLLGIFTVACSGAGEVADEGYMGSGYTKEEFRRKGSQYPASVRIYGGACYLQWPDILDKHTH